MRRWRNGLAADVQAALQRLTPDQAPTRPDPISSMQVQNLADLTMDDVALEARETPMTETQLGQTYTALAVATALVGQANASLFLAAIKILLLTINFRCARMLHFRAPRIGITWVLPFYIPA